MTIGQTYEVIFHAQVDWFDFLQFDQFCGFSGMVADGMFAMAATVYYAFRAHRVRLSPLFVSWLIDQLSGRKWYMIPIFGALILAPFIMMMMSAVSRLAAHQADV